MKFLLPLVIGLMLTMSVVAVAGGPGMINYQGQLNDNSGNPVPDGNYNVVFSIYNQLAGGLPVWAETTSVTVVNGIFTKTLGSTHAIARTIFEDDPTYLGIKVGTNAEMTPRARLVSVPYAIQANRADTASVSLSGPVGNGGWS